MTETQPPPSPDVPGSAREARRVTVWALLTALLSVVLKGCLLAAGSFPFHSDEAIVALMARHILQGQWPAFFYGQAYMGSLDAALVALGFAAFGEHVAVIRWIQALLRVVVSSEMDTSSKSSFQANEAFPW